MEIPFLDLKAQNNSVKLEILPLWEEILSTAGFIGGKHVTGFEEEFAAACGVKHGVLVNSGTDALRFIFMALDLKPGNEVITVPNTFIATTEAITQAGGRIVFVDVKPDTYNIDPAKIEAAITPRTKGIVPVHLYGQPADMEAIQEIADRHGLWVVEDACQAHLAEYRGRKAGGLGVAAAFSFYPGKNLGACGEGGLIATNDPEIARKSRMIRDHGQAQKYYHDIEGYNGRCDAVQAAALRVKLRHLPGWTAARRAHAAQYLKLLAGRKQISLPFVDPKTAPAWHLFVVQVDRRDEILEGMKQKGIACALHYPVPLHRQKAYAWMGLGEGSFPVSEKYSARLLSLPMYAELSENQIEYVCSALIEQTRE